MLKKSFSSLLFIIILLSLSFSVLAETYTSSLIPNPGHVADQILVKTSDGQEITLQKAIDDKVISGTDSWTEFNGHLIRSSGNVGIGMDASTSPTEKLDVNGNIKVSGEIVAPEGTLRDDNGGWVRTYGDTGWHSESYDGGLYMSDTTWLRAYNDKWFYTAGVMRADSGIRASQYCDIDGNSCKTAADLGGVTSCRICTRTYSQGCYYICWTTWSAWTCSPYSSGNIIQYTGATPSATVTGIQNAIQCS